MADERVGVYPGTFDPLTVAHLAVADAAKAQLALDRLVLALSVDPIGKARADNASLRARAEEIRAAAGPARPWLDVAATDRRLIGDIALDYAVCVLGADKWEQVLDPVHYPTREEHAAALLRLPTLGIAPRDGSVLHPAPDGVAVVLLEVPEHVAGVSSSAVRSGRTDWRASAPPEHGR